MNREDLCGRCTQSVYSDVEIDNIQRDLTRCGDVVEFEFGVDGRLGRDGRRHDHRWCSDRQTVAGRKDELFFFSLCFTHCS